MSERTKKLIVFSLFLLSVFAIAFALYWTFFKSEGAPSQPSVESPPTGSGAGGLPGRTGERTPITEQPATGGSNLPPASPIAEGGVTITTGLSTGPVYNTALSSDGSSVNYYSKGDNRFYRINDKGEVEALSQKQFPNVDRVAWDRTGDKAVMEFPDGSNVVFDFATNQQVTLPAHWEDFQFSPVHDEIIAKSMGLDPDNRWLVTVNADGSNAKAFQALGENADFVQVNWSPNDQVVAFADTASDAISGDIDRKIIFPIGKNKENYKGLVVEGLNFESKWSPSGKKLLYSVSGSYSNYRPLLWTVDATSTTMGENRKSIQLNTYAEKCTWSSSVDLYCAVPQNLPANAGLQPSLYAQTPDQLYKTNIETGLTTLVATPQIDTTMKDLTVSKDGSTLYYTNALTDELEMIKLN